MFAELQPMLPRTSAPAQEAAVREAHAPVQDMSEVVSILQGMRQACVNVTNDAVHAVTLQQLDSLTSFSKIK